MYLVHSYSYVYPIVLKIPIAIRSFWFDPNFNVPLIFFTVNLTYSEVRVAMSYVVALGAQVRLSEVRPRLNSAVCGRKGLCLHASSFRCARHEEL